MTLKGQCSNVAKLGGCKVLEVAGRVSQVRVDILVVSQVGREGCWDRK